jgi:hypothetical protein
VSNGAAGQEKSCLFSSQGRHSSLFYPARLKRKKIGVMADLSEMLFGAGGRIVPAWNCPRRILESDKH